MTKRFIRISKDEVRRILFLKNELRRVLLKSIKRNQQIEPIKRIIAQHKIQNSFLYLSRQKNFCVKTGKSGGVYKFSNLSRHMINKNAQQGYLINIKTNNSK